MTHLGDAVDVSQLAPQHQAELMVNGGQYFWSVSEECPECEGTGRRRR